MKKFLSIIALLIATCPLFGQATTGFHRVDVALTRASSGVDAQIVPYATVTVTDTATGAAATIYYDPLLSNVISPSVVTADSGGNYGYYIALSYCVTETITSPGQGTKTITNICNNGGGGGSGTVSGQAAGVVPLATAPTIIGAQSHLNENTAGFDTFTQPVVMPESITELSPVIDIRALGAVPDGSTPIDTALQEAVNECIGFGSTPSGQSCEILLPCNGQGCFLQNPSAITFFNNTKIHLQGNLVTRTSIGYQNAGVYWEGDGELSSQIIGPLAYGTLGTNITSTNTPVAISPSFAASPYGYCGPGPVYQACSVANDLPTNAFITIGAPISCTISSITRTANAVKAVVSGAAGSCRIPQGTPITVSGVTDSSFNINQTSLVANGTGLNGDIGEYVTNTFTWDQTGSNGSSSGGTIIGMNEDKFETVRILDPSTCGATSGQICVATNFTHASTDFFGEGVFGPRSTSGTTVKDLSIESRAGMAVWYEGMYNFTFDGAEIVATSPANAPYTSSALELDSTGQGIIRNTKLTNPSLFGAPPTNAGPPFYPYGLHCTQLGSYRNPSGDGACGFLTIDNPKDYLYGGIKVDTDNLGVRIAATFTVLGEIGESIASNFFQIDNRQGNAPVVTVLSLNQQDFINQNCLVGYTDQNDAAGATTFYGTPFLPGCVRNKYYSGQTEVHNANNDSLTLGNGVPVGIFTDSGQIKTEVINEGASLGPSVIPFSTFTLAVPGSCTGGSCTINTGIRGPDGSSSGSGSGIEIINTAGSSVSIYGAGPSKTTATYAGDWVLYGCWVRPGSGQNQLSSFWGGTSVTLLGSSGDTFTQGNGDTSLLFPFDITLFNDWWHPVVGLATFLTGNSTPHALTVQEWPGSAVGLGNQFAGCWGAFIPGPNNPAYDGKTTIDMLEAARQDLYHGLVPGGYTGGTGHAATLEQIDATGFNILNAASGAVTPILPITSLTTIGTSGASTLVAGVLNIPNYSGGGVSPGSGYALPAYPSGSSSTVSPSNITTDATGNNLIVPGNTTVTGNVNTSSIYEVSGTQIATGNLGDWTNAGVVNGDCAIWASGTSKWTPGSCTSGGSVASFSGDGNLINNSASTGAVTVTLATAGAHKWWGNNTGSTAAPGYETIGTGDLPTIPIAGGGTNATTATAGSIPNATSSSASSWTKTPTLGASGTVGTIAFGNATSGTVTLGTVAGALGSVTASLPANSGTIAETNLAETFSALQTFSAGINLSGATSPLEVGGSAGTSGQCLTSAGASTTPTWSACSSATINAASQYSPTYYSAAGSASTLSGVAPFNGIQYDSTTGAPAAATASQVVTVIGSTAVTNANNVETAVSTSNAAYSILSVPTTSGYQQPVTVASFTINPQTGAVNFPTSLSIGTSPPSPCGGTGTGCITLKEAGTAGTPTSTLDYCRADSTSHGFMCSINGGAEFFSAMNVAASVSNAITSATGGSGTGTVTCLTASCTNLRGTYSVAGGTFTTGNLLVLVWPTTTNAYSCIVSQNGGVATYGIGHSVATATGMNITAGISVLGVTVTFDYACIQ
jgi:hypothetical protein